MDPSLVNEEMDCVYLCGNSLGLQPKEADIMVKQEMEKWQQMYVCCLCNSRFSLHGSDKQFLSKNVVHWVSCDNYHWRLIVVVMHHSM